MNAIAVVSELYVCYTSGAVLVVNICVGKCVFIGFVTISPHCNRNITFLIVPVFEAADHWFCQNRKLNILIKFMQQHIGTYTNKIIQQSKL